MRRNTFIFSLKYFHESATLLEELMKFLHRETILGKI